MSRSYRKNPIIKDYSRSYTKWIKRHANKVVRRHKGKIPDGNYYRKIFNSYDIHDQVCHGDLKHTLDRECFYNSLGLSDETYEETLIWYNKTYVYK